MSTLPNGRTARYKILDVTMVLGLITLACGCYTIGPDDKLCTSVAIVGVIFAYIMRAMCQWWQPQEWMWYVVGADEVPFSDGMVYPTIEKALDAAIESGWRNSYLPQYIRVWNNAV